MLKIFFSLWMAVLCCFFLAVPSFALEAPDISAKSAVVIDMKTGRILYERAPRERLPMASTTKMMTTLLALEEPDIDSYFTVDPEAVYVEGSSMGLLEGDSVSLRQLCYGMLLPSGNDAANVVAMRLGGSASAFAALMNQRAFQLSLTDTAFVTPSGLDAEGHYSSALDLATLGRYCMEDPVFREIAGLYRAKTLFGNPPYERWLKNHNKLLELYASCTGIKTGFTEGAGRVLVSGAAEDTMELICVTMNDPDDWRDHENLYRWLFLELTDTEITPLLTTPSLSVAGLPEKLPTKTAPLSLPLKAGEWERLSVQIETRPFFYGPVYQGDLAGSVKILLDGEEIYRQPLQFAEDGIPKQEKSGLLALLER